MTKDSSSSGSLGPYSSDFDAQWERIAGEPVPALPTIRIGEERVVTNDVRHTRPKQRRRGTRFPAQLPALLLTADRHTAVHCSAIDVSLSGALLRLPARPFSSLEQLRLCLALPGGILNTWARPVRSNHHGHAFEFIGLAARELVQIAVYIHDSFGPGHEAPNGPDNGLWRLAAPSGSR